jgi:hypothetical protein
VAIEDHKRWPPLPFVTHKKEKEKEKEKEKGKKVKR